MNCRASATLWIRSAWSIALIVDALKRRLRRDAPQGRNHRRPRGVGTSAGNFACGEEDSTIAATAGAPAAADCAGSKQGAAPYCAARLTLVRLGAKTGIALTPALPLRPHTP